MKKQSRIKRLKAKAFLAWLKVWAAYQMCKTKPSVSVFLNLIKYICQVLFAALVKKMVDVLF